MNFDLLDFNIDNQVQKIAICVSGGADSMYLLTGIVNKLMNFNHNCSEIHVLHVNHGISSHSKSWENTVRQYVNFCNSNLSIHQSQFKIIFAYTELELKLNAKSSSDLSETHCRNLRYDFIYNYCYENQIYDIFTGHHKNDNNEHRLISVFRNRQNEINLPAKQKSEIKLSIKKQFVLNKHKPLLSLTKDAILNFCNEYGIPYVHDESNDRQDCLRNVLRNGLFGGLAELGDEVNEHYLNSFNHFFEHYEMINDFYNKQVNLVVNQALTTKRVTQNKSRYSFVVDMNAMDYAFVSNVISNVLRLHYNNVDFNNEYHVVKLDNSNSRKKWLADKVKNHIENQSQGLITFNDNIKINFMFDNNKTDGKTESEIKCFISIVSHNI